MIIIMATVSKNKLTNVTLASIAFAALLKL